MLKKTSRQESEQNFSPAKVGSKALPQFRHLVFCLGFGGSKLL